MMNNSKLALPICLITGLSACSSFDLTRASDLPELQGATPETVHSLFGQPTTSLAMADGEHKDVFVFSETSIDRVGYRQFRPHSRVVSSSSAATQALVGHNNVSLHQISRYKCSVEAQYQDGLVKSVYVQPRGCVNLEPDETTQEQS